MSHSIVPYNQFELNKYLEHLSRVASLSTLFSDSVTPLLHYRATENIYCKSFKARNESRSDVSIDAKLKNIGVGIKTFIEGNKSTLQKIAEFNKQIPLYKDLNSEDKIKKIAELRNNRIEFTKNLYKVDKFIYHCIVRNKSGLYLYEEPMLLIDISNIKIIESDERTILFNDGIHEYSFNISKSTLYKRFDTSSYFANVKVQILDDPLEYLKSLPLNEIEPKISEHIVIPLYSYKGTSKKIYEKSGLNQWNASGRIRHNDEAYIPFPAHIRSNHENFFPNRDTPFNVKLPNEEVISMKISQDNGKALMSNPNKALGKWLLRDVLKIPHGTLVTYETLLSIGIDCLIFHKTEDEYTLDFGAVGEFENFLENTEDF